jgi:hypothetical protein
LESPKEKKSLNPFAATFFLKRFIRQKRSDFDAKTNVKSQVASEIAASTSQVPSIQIEIENPKPEIEVIVPEVEIEVADEPDLFPKVVVRVNQEDMELPVKMYAAEKLVKWQKMLRRTASVNALALPPKQRMDSISPK